MKIEKLRLKNFAQFEDFEIVFNNGITNLVGMNGDGKTTVGLTALWAGFRGIAEKGTSGALPGQRFRFITKGKKSLDVEITLRDELTQKIILLKRHITKSTNTITIHPEDGVQIDRQYVENLFSVSFLSATHFSALTGKEQAAAMGIDTLVFDKDLKDKKEDAQGYRRDIKKIGDLVPVAECTKKDIGVLYENQKKATEHNTEQARLTAQLSTWRDKITDVNGDIDEEIRVFDAYKANHEKKVSDLNEIRINASITVKEFPPINDPIDLEPIEEEIKTIVESNQKYYAYETYKNDVEELSELQEYLEQNLELQKDIQDERAKYLQSKSFGIKCLQIDEDGNLTKDGKLIREPYFSRGELEVLVARIGMNLNPELKVRFIDNFDLIDDDNQEKLIKHLTKKGFQIITATVGREKKDNNSVLLRECKLVTGPVDDELGTNSPDNTEDDWDKPDGKELTTIEADVLKIKDVCKDPGVTGPTIVKTPEPAPEVSGTQNYDDDEF